MDVARSRERDNFAPPNFTPHFQSNLVTFRSQSPPPTRHRIRSNILLPPFGRVFGPSQLLAVLQYP
jgi:hypothetical protein